MAIDRRQLIVGSFVALGAAAHSVRLAGAAAGPAIEFVAAARLADGSFAVVLISSDGQVTREIPLSARGHDIAVDPPRRRAAAFARRPGYFAVAFDLDGKTEPVLFTPPDNRHFFGHGAFSPDGRLLYATENDIDTGNGVIGIYDTGTFARVGEHATYGLGPHEAVLLADGRTLAVANGGFATEPSSGREPIDLAGMDPTLTFVDAVTGDLKARHALPKTLNLLSMRHLAASPSGTVWFGAQWQGSLESAPELIGSASLDKPITLLECGPPEGIRLRGYIGSVALDPAGRLLAASAPRAGRVLIIDTEAKKIVRNERLADGCGVAAAGLDTFAMTSGLGDLRTATADGAAGRTIQIPGIEFDNHLRRASSV